MSSRWHEQYYRVKRWIARLTTFGVAVDENLVDDCYCFFTCCLHLKDWVKNDRTDMANAVENLVNTDQWLMICADVANGSKHLKLNRWRIDAEAHLEKETFSFDTAGFHEDAFLSRDIIMISVSGTQWNAIEVAKMCVAAWDSFLATRGLLPPS